MSEVGAAQRDQGVALIGRVRELGMIETFLERAAHDGDALLLSGEPGVGKTSLLDQAAQAALQSGARILRAAGVQVEAGMSFTGLNLVLLPLFGDLGRLGDSHREALNVALGLGEGKMPDLMLISNATLTLFRQAAADRPLLLLVDDLHWLDRASAFVLGFVARRLAESNVGFLAAFRSGEETFFDRSGLPDLVVQPLDEMASDQLLRDRFPELVPQVRERVLAEAEGNPLALLELPVALTALQRAALETLPLAIPLSRRLKALYEARIARLSEATLNLLLLMALDGTGDVRVLRGASDEREGLQLFAPAEKAGLAYLDTRGRRLSFRHPLIRAAVVDAASTEDRLRAHRVLAELWAEQAERHTWHLAESTIEPDEHVADLLEQSAYRILRRGDAVGAIARLTWAAELSPWGLDRGRRLAKAAYLGTDVTGDLRNASRLVADAQDADPEFKNTLQSAVTAAVLLIKGAGDVDTAHRLLVGAIEATPNAGDAAYEEALTTLANVCFLSGREEMWTSFHSALARLGRDAPWALSLSTRTVADTVRAAPTALPELEMAVAGLANEVDPAEILRIAIAATYVDRLDGCLQALWRVIEDGRAGGAVASAIQAMILVARYDSITGHWDEARELLVEAIQLCDAIGYELFGWSARYIMAAIAALRGDYGAVKAMTDTLLHWAEPRRIGAVAEYYSHVRALSALGKGDFEEAYQQTAAISEAGILPSQLASLAVMDFVESAVHTNRYAEAATHVVAMHKAGLSKLSSRFALLVGGSAAMAAEQDEAAIALFKEALSIPGIDRWPCDVARVELAYGARLRRTRALAESRVHLGRAVETFERLGARPWADRAGNELRASGQTRPRRGHHAMDALTAQEREIAQLAAAGLTNKQIGQRLFLSPRTVGGHLHRLFPKVGVSTRAALRDALNSLGQEQRGGSA